MESPSKRPLRNTFIDTTPSNFDRAAGNAKAISMLGSIERRAEALKARAVAHAKAFEDRWTAKEGMHLWKRYLANQGKHPAPPNVHEIGPEAVMKTAARNVSARTQRRLARINAIKTRMSNAVVRSIETRGLTRQFEKAHGPLQNKTTLRNKP